MKSHFGNKKNCIQKKSVTHNSKNIIIIESDSAKRVSACE